MKLSKKTLISLVVFIILALILLVILIKIKSYKEVEQTSNSKNEILFEKKSFTEREDIIKDILSKKLSVSFDKASLMIAREEPGYINGVFYSDELINKNQNKIYFYAINSGENIEVVWYGDTDPDCQIIRKYNFPKEMSGNCQ